MQTLLLRKEAMEEEKLTIEESIERLNNRILVRYALPQPPPPPANALSHPNNKKVVTELN